VATSNGRHAHTGMTHYEKGVPRIPAAALSNPDADLLEARIRADGPIRFRLELGCRYMPDATSANVIGEIPGRERPQEIVLLAAHLDSWDLGTGALDDGAGCAIIIEAARLIGGLDPPPRRTIRVLLAANEEFGVSGGLAYGERHAGEMNLHIAGMEADFGAARVWGMRSRVARSALPAVRELALLLAPLGIGYHGNETLGGTDLLPLMRFDLPVFDLPQDATRYFDAYHSVNDTLDKVDPKDLAQVVAAYAVVALVAAEIEGDFGRAPKLRWPLPTLLERLAEGKELFR
jgi:Zn-dependent M28 family amino/carboxypeptidase